MPNHLIGETSPYLLQHSGNPVDWYPWGEEALEKARREEKPIFLSIGYSSCHWCHVMAHESFNDEETAALMNQNFVNIKVDREERPDLDSIYMTAVVAFTGQGGWPMSLFLMPDGKPFYGGTYFPPVARFGMPSFRDLLQTIAMLWSQDRSQLETIGSRLVEYLHAQASWGAITKYEFKREDLEIAVTTLLAQYDWEYGGWGRAPRFPAPMCVEFLLQQATRGNHQANQTALHVLKAMQRGGLFDVVGGGFHRYSTDDQWLVPHFEKMLYDNAQMARVYLHAYQLSGENSFKRTCESTLDFMLRELASPEGGFYSSLDADSEGQEGKFYVWTRQEIEQALGDREHLNFFTQVYHLPINGNFEGKFVLQRKDDDDVLAQRLNIPLDEYYQKLDTCHASLQSVRKRRMMPALDDKVLSAWNGMAIQTMAEAGRVLVRKDFLAAAQKAAHFIHEQMVRQGELLRSWRAGQSRLPAYLEDYASLGIALINLYQSDFDPHWLEWAGQIAGTMMAHFSDSQGGFFDTSDKQPDLLIRPKDMQDNATPAGNSLALLFLMTLSEYTGDQSLTYRAGILLGAINDLLIKAPSAFAYWLQAADFLVGPIQQIALIWPINKMRPNDILDYLHRSYLPRSILAASALPNEKPLPVLLANRPLLDNQPTVYVCHNFTCLRPINTLEELKGQLSTSFMGDVTNVS